MRKLVFILSFISLSVSIEAQNLLKNPEFENWTSNKPDNWAISGTSTVTQSTITPNSTGSALQIAATATVSATQYVNAPNGVSFDTTKQYQIIVKYKATAGDGTDSRVWCNWITSEIGAATTKYWTMSLKDSLGLKGPGGNAQPATNVPGNGTNGYLTSNINGDYLSYTYSFYPPANATQFYFQVRTYNKGTVVWDDFYFGEKIATKLTSAKTKANFYVANKVLYFENVAMGSKFEIYNLLGNLIKQDYVNGSKYNLSNLTSGFYFVKISNITKRISL